MDDNKKQVLEEIVRNLEKEHGKGIIMRLGDQSVTQIETISTGSIALNSAVGIGGYPKGRILEIYGPESSGKTTLSLHAIAEAQKQGDVAAFIDAEHALDTTYAKNIGVDTENLYVSQPNNGEQALEILDELLCSRAFSVIVIDSVAALVPRAEIEGSMGDPHMALQARLMSQALRKITGSVSKSNTCVIFINQIRSKIGIMFGNPETTTGGNALKFYTSLRLDIRKIESIKKGDQLIGSKVKVKVVKNKLAPPFKLALFDIYYGEGISRTSEILDIAVQKDVIKKSGSWFSYQGERIGQGIENAKANLKEHPSLLQSIEKALQNILKIDNNPQNNKKIIPAASCLTPLSPPHRLPLPPPHPHPIPPPPIKPCLLKKS